MECKLIEAAAFEEAAILPAAAEDPLLDDRQQGLFPRKGHPAHPRCQPGQIPGIMEEWITRKSPEYRELQEKALAALDRIEAMIETLPGHLNAESYLTSEEVRNLFGLSQRSLQTYRDERIIPYTILGGKFLYPMSEIAKILEKNLVKPIQR